MALRPASRDAVDMIRTSDRPPSCQTGAARRGLDPESQAWIERLAPGSPDLEAGIEELHSLLLKGARFEVSRRRAMLPHLWGDDYDDLAQQSADDALLAVLRKLGDFRGESRFTTWAYKFALLERREREFALAPGRDASSDNPILARFASCGQRLSRTSR